MCVCMYECCVFSLSPLTTLAAHKRNILCFFCFFFLCVSVCLRLLVCECECECEFGHPPAVLLLLLNDPCSAWEPGVSQRRD